MTAIGGAVAFCCVLGMAAAAPSDPVPAAPAHGGAAGGEPGKKTDEERAALRYEEMLAKMQSAVEEIALLYGNPLFLQVYTNDEARAAELKLRLSDSGREKALRGDLADLEKRKEDILGDIALRERESRRLAEKLARQRAALDALSSALDQARKAAEDSAR